MTGLINSRYQILEVIGRGGMGVVYKADDTKHHRTVALKVLSFGGLGEVYRALLMRETRIAATLDHSNICQVYEVGQHSGRLFIAMGYVDGSSLGDKIKEHRLPFEDTIDIAIQIAEGLQEAHKHGVIHRDIKPSNVLLTKEGQVKIADFGIACVVGRRQGKRKTDPSTIQYKSPERCCGVALDRRSDIWSLGVLLYEMLTGRLPFKGDSEKALVNSMVHDRPELVTAKGMHCDPVEINKVIAKALAKNPAERYQYAIELAGELRHIAREPNRHAVSSKRNATITSVMPSACESVPLSFIEADDLEDVVLLRVLAMSEEEIESLALVYGCAELPCASILSLASAAARLYRARNEQIPEHVKAALRKAL